MQTHAALYSDLKARGVSFTVMHEYSSDIFTGAAITVGATTVSVKRERDRYEELIKQDLATLANVTGIIVSTDLFPQGFLKYY